jgi:CubicO group peptidase (beta-lactamase class C family)
MTLDGIIQPYIDNQTLLGVSIAVVKAQELVYSQGFGIANAETQTAVTAKTLFSLRSVCKTICATLIMRLVEAGKLELDTPIVNYLPNLRFSHQIFGNKVTLRHLLSHSSGLPAFGKTRGPRYAESLGEFVHQQIPYYTFLAEPGTLCLYSNAVFCIAGRVAEAVTRKFYDALVDEYVLEPLGMASVSFDPSVYATFPLALPHTKAEGQPFQVVHELSYNMHGNPSAFAYGNVLDLAKFAAMFLGNGQSEGQSFLSSQSVQEMCKPQASFHKTGLSHPIDNTSKDYGLGFWSGEYQGKKFVGHDGRDSTYMTGLHLFPDDDTALLFMTNHANEQVIAELLVSLYDYILGLPQQGVVRLETPVSVPLPPNLDHYQDTFINIQGGTVASFHLINDKLFIKWEDKDFELICFGNHQFYFNLTDVVRLPVVFLEQSSGKFQHVMIDGLPYHRMVSIQTITAEAASWKHLEGLYKDPSNLEPKSMVEVSVQRGQLTVSDEGTQLTCQPLDDITFLTKHGVI